MKKRRRSFWTIARNLMNLSNYLYEKETITGDEFMAILNGSETKEANDHEKTV